MNPNSEVRESFSQVPRPAARTEPRYLAAGRDEFDDEKDLRGYAAISEGGYSTALTV
jgi:hypothetical protein